MSRQALQERRRRFKEDLAKRQSKDVEYIIREIALPRLPAKSLLKFRAVCRDWRHIINSPFFKHNQSHSHSKMSGLFRQASSMSPPSFISLDEAAYGVPDPSLSFLPVPVDIRSSCNGLLLCQGRTGQKHYYVCNPVNMEWKVLPKPSYDHGHTPAIVLVFEPSVLNFAADYKVFCAIESLDIEGATEFEMYSSEKGSWKLSKEICFNQKVTPGSGLYVDKRIYWPAKHIYTGGLIGFDPVNEHAVVHGAYEIYRGNNTLIELYGQLCYASIAGSNLVVNVANLYQNTLPMGAIKGSNSKLCVPVDRAILGNNNDAQVLPSVGGDVLVFRAGRTIASYHIFRKEFKVLTTVNEFLQGNYFPYVNSLVSVSSSK